MPLHGPAYIEGIRFKGTGSYLSHDGDNPEAPGAHGYGWPLGTECWWYLIEINGHLIYATGATPESATRRRDELLDRAWRGELIDS